jgi:hypothetical protein
LHPEVPAYVTQKSSTTRYVQARAPSLATCSLHPIPHKRHLQCPTSQTPITVPNTLSASEHTPSAPGSSPPDAPSRQPHPPSRPLLLPHIYKTRRFPPVASPCTQSPTAATVAHIQTPPAYHRSRQPLIVSLPLVLPHRHKTRPTHPLASPRTQSRTGASRRRGSRPLNAIADPTPGTDPPDRMVARLSLWMSLVASGQVSSASSRGCFRTLKSACVWNAALRGATSSIPAGTTWRETLTHSQRPGYGHPLCGARQTLRAGARPGSGVNTPGVAPS